MYKGRDSIILNHPLQVKEECLDHDNIPRPGHACMNTKITYEDTPPRAGNHRPLWPAFGEYRFLPEPRWVHALEHGAAVFLYHPCADKVRDNFTAHWQIWGRGVPGRASLVTQFFFQFHAIFFEILITLYVGAPLTWKVITRTENPGWDGAPLS